MWKYFVAACFSYVAVMGSAGAAPSPTPIAISSGAGSPAPAPTSVVDFAKSRIDTMFRTDHVDRTWFSASFLAQFPDTRIIDDYLAQLKGKLGDYKSVEFTPAKFIAHFAKGTNDVLLHLDADNKIDLLFFPPPAISS
jgi:hypothetical protein